MKKFIFLISILVLTSINIKAQVTEWAEKIAGTGDDRGHSIAIDGTGNVYVVGDFTSTTLTFNNGITLTNSGNSDAYIAKYNNNGICHWAQKIAGTNQDYGNGIAVDGSGNVYVTGYFTSTTLTFNNGKSLLNSGNSDAYIAKYNSSGVCQWAEKIHGTSSDFGKSIAVDGSGNVYVTGSFASPTLFLNNGITLTNSGSSDAYIAKYSSSGTCQWAQKIAGTDYDIGNSIAVDGSGNVYVVGYFKSTTLTLNNGITLTNSTSTYDAYIAKYNSSGLCQWAQKIAGTAEDYGRSIAVDGSGNVYVAGEFHFSTLTLNNGITLTNSTGFTDAYIAKYNSSGSCQWAQKIAGTSYDYGFSIAVDGSGNVYVAGSFYSTTLTLNNGITLTNSTSTYDAYIAKYNTNGTCQWAEKIGGTNGDDVGNDVAVDGSDNVYVTGTYASTPLTLNNGKTLSNSGSSDAYIAKYSQFIPTEPTITSNNISNIGATSASSGGEITDDGGADVIARGVCWSTSQNPTIDNSKTNNGTGVGQFTSNLTDLEPKSTYYVRAYATNSVGTAYGEEFSFNTLIDESNMKLLSFQGILKNAQGNLVANGDYSLTFRIYKKQSGGTAIWNETQTVNVKSGLFNTELGLINKLDLPFDTSYWLGIQVSNDSAELTPRRRLTGAIYNTGFGK